MALFTSAEFKSHEGISTTDHDTFITALIARTGDFVNKYLGRKVESASYTEFYDGSGTGTLQLANSPVTAVTSVHIDQERDFGSAALVSSSNYVIYQNEGWLRWIPEVTTGFTAAGHFPVGVQNVKVIYTGGFSSVPDDIKEAAILWSSAIFNRRRRAGLQAISSGSFSITYQTTTIPAEVKGLLDPYRMRGVVGAYSA